MFEEAFLFLKDTHYVQFVLQMNGTMVSKGSRYIIGRVCYDHAGELIKVNSEKN